MNYTKILFFLLLATGFSFTIPAKRTLGVLIMERRNASSAIKWVNVEHGDTLHYMNYASKSYPADPPRFLMYTFQVFKNGKTTDQKFSLEITQYKGKDSVAFCQTSLLPDVSYVCEQTQLDVTTQRIRLLDAEGYQYTLLLLLDGKMNENKRPFAYYDY